MEVLEKYAEEAAIPGAVPLLWNIRVCLIQQEYLIWRKAKERGARYVAGNFLNPGFTGERKKEGTSSPRD